MDEPDPSPQDPEPPDLGFAARCGEKTLALLDAISRPAMLWRREAAVWQGIGVAVGRVFLGVFLIVICYLFSKLCVLAAESVDHFIDFPRYNWVNEGMMAFLWVLASLATFVACLMDLDEKWRKLSWLLFAMTAFGILMHWGSTPLYLAIIGGQFCIHWFIEAALRQRERRWAHERDLAAASRRGPPLREQYRGVAGFTDESTESREA